MSAFRAVIVGLILCWSETTFSKVERKKMKRQCIAQRNHEHIGVCSINNLHNPISVSMVPFSEFVSSTRVHCVSSSKPKIHRIIMNTRMYALCAYVMFAIRLVWKCSKPLLKIHSHDFVRNLFTIFESV